MFPPVNECDAMYLPENTPCIISLVIFTADTRLALLMAAYKNNAQCSSLLNEMQLPYLLVMGANQTLLSIIIGNYCSDYSTTDWNSIIKVFMVK